ncbi:MAG: HlyD family efflux transporter periplasmic adaptor subunit [Oscillospiraceae bacterium]|nr:HlyD family efflux transporter periplasmic adaptor subunit [Oscillospiraceae bacterium]
MEMKVKNRAWVKNAVIVFLVILLILTFFSNTIMNRSLAEVATQNVMSGSITARVRGSGTVTATGAYEVKATQTREIRSVMVKVGQQVSQGDVLFVLGEGDSEELETAKENLRQLELSKQRMTAGLSGTDYTLDEREIEKQQEKLEEAREAEALAYLALESGAGVPEYELRQAHAKVETMEKRVAAAREALTAAQAAFTEKQTEAQQRVDDALARLNELLDNPPAEDEEPEEGEEKTEYERKLEEAQAALSAAQMAQAALDPATDAGILDAQAALDEAELNLELANQELESLTGMAGSYAEAYAAAQAARQEAEDELFRMEYELNQRKIADGKSAASTYIELQDLDYQIGKAKEAIEKLSGGEEDQVVANVSGIIESINFTAGNTPGKGETLCSIQVPDLGYTLSFTVTSDQARRLRTGDEATVSNYWWGREIFATLASIRNDPQNPQNSRILTFDVTGDVSPGMELTLSVGSKSQSYELIVPNSAIRSDSNGSFVLRVEAKNSPLGNRYYARRVDVTVLASDDVNSAVSGELGYGDFVVTTSNKPVKAGDMVRMPD